MAIDIAALKTEINTDPQTLGLTFAKSDGDNAALLNAAGSASAVVDTTVSASDLIKACRDPAFATQWPTLDQWKKDLWMQILTATSVQGPDVGIKDLCTDVWPGGGVRNKLLNIIERAAVDASRAEELFGENAKVRWEDVFAARNA